MRIFRIFSGLFLILLSTSVVGQNIGINEDGSAPDASAILDIKSIDKGLLVPRLTTAQRTGIASPATGLIVYDTTTSGFWYYDGSAWIPIASGTIAGNTLDDAYDQGGPGAGRIIDADAGVVSVQGTDGFEVTGTYNSGSVITTTGAGTRMLFNPRKGAFRAGTATANEWDNGNVGNYSIAMGNNALASGNSSTSIGNATIASAGTSFAIGNEVEATGTGAFAIGNGAVASGLLSMALGYNSQSNGLWSHAFGHTAIASGSYSVSLGGTTNSAASYSLAGPGGTTTSNYGFAMGQGSTASNYAMGFGFNSAASGTYSVAAGSNSTASGSASVAMGLGGVSSGAYSVTLGQSNTASENSSIAAGRQNTASGQYSVAMGYNNTASATYATAFGNSAEASGLGSFGAGVNTLSQGQGSVALGSNTEATSNYSFAAGSNTEASNTGAVAMGNATTASGLNSAAFNNGSTASGSASAAFGNSDATGIYSFAIGNLSTAGGSYSFAGGTGASASATQTFAFGNNASASGSYSTAMNYYTNADAFASTAFGRFNVGGGNPNTWTPLDPIFEIGVGASSLSTLNALTVLKNGNTGIMNANPDATLDVVGTFQLVDGNQAAGRVLTSDAAGNASWAVPATGGNTLDQAYDQGGLGAGRTINAENGAVSIVRNSSFGGTALEISLNSAYTLSERSAINTINPFAGFETYTNINRTSGPSLGQAFLIMNEASSNINGRDGVAIEFNQTSTLNYVSDNRGFVYDVTYNGGSGASLFGYQANIEGTGSATKYGTHITIPSTSGGIHYGIYSDVQDASGYAAYLLGRTSLGNSASNRYLMPAADGSAGQVMTTDGAGNVSWSTPAGGGGSLDEAYDNGGSGTGRVITADAGAVSVQGTDGFEVTGTFNTGATIGSPGAGTRMIFNPRKAAFRAGRVTGTQWNDANVGTGSVAFGLNNTVSGSYSVAFGNSNQVISPYSVAMGENCDAQGAFSVAMGGSASAIGESAIAIGEAATAFGDLSVAFSEGTANGGSSLAHGKGVIAAGSYEFAIGEYNTLYTPNGTNTDQAFVVGNGTAPAARSNALLLKKNGELTINDEYTLPNTDGSEGQTLVTDGAGAVSWSGPVAFSAYLNSSTSATAGNFDMTTVEFASNCTFNTAQSRFDVPMDGIYSFTINDVSQATLNSPQGIRILNGSTIVRQANWTTQNTGTTARTFTFLIELSAGDVIYFDKIGNRTLAGSTSAPVCRVSGHLIR